MLECAVGQQHTILTTAYATGLRVSELTRLRPTDIDSKRMVMRVEQGKGQKDRYVMLSPGLRHTTPPFRLCSFLKDNWPRPGAILRQSTALVNRFTCCCTAGNDKSLGRLSMENMENTLPNAPPVECVLG